MKKILLLVVVLIAMFTGCGEKTEVANNEKVIMQGGDFKLLEYMPDNENYMISPFSIKMAMMMAANGGEGATQQEILDAFGVEDIDEYNNFAKNIIDRYNKNEKVKINVANSIWIKDDLRNLDFTKEYKDLISEYFDGTASKVKGSDAVETINEWCSEKTNGKIKELIPTSNFDAALVNAIYFKGEWAKKFEEYSTKKDNFTTYDGSIVEKEFMNQIEEFAYYEDENMQIVEMPYADYNTSMYVVLKNNDDKIDIEEAIEKMKSTRVHIKFPKFKVEYNDELSGILQQIGIKTAFSGNAEFKNKMFGNSFGMFIDMVLHKTFIEVDEQGTEAAAATAILMKEFSAVMEPVEEPKEFIADKPFMYFIRDNESGAILFMGEIVK